MRDLVKKVSKIQQELKAPKSQRNKFGGYNYRNCEDILEAVKPLLGDLILTISDSIEVVGNRVYVKSTAVITDGENKIENIAFAREAEDKKGMDLSQITGATSSYARKYALNGLFCIDDTKDADSMDNKKPQYMGLQKDYEGMINMVASGDRTPEQIINNLEQKFTVDDKVKAKIMEINNGAA